MVLLLIQIDKVHYGDNFLLKWNGSFICRHESKIAKRNGE